METTKKLSEECCFVDYTVEHCMANTDFFPLCAAVTTADVRRKRSICTGKKQFPFVITVVILLDLHTVIAAVRQTI